jgi:hypothetical protein
MAHCGGTPGTTWMVSLWQNATAFVICRCRSVANAFALSIALSFSRSHFLKNAAGQRTCADCAISIERGTSDASKCAFLEHGISRGTWDVICCNCAKTEGWYQCNYDEFGCSHCKARASPAAAPSAAARQERQQARQQPIGAMSWECPQCPITVERSTSDASKCAYFDPYASYWDGRCCNCAKTEGLSQSNYDNFGCAHCKSRGTEAESKMARHCALWSDIEGNLDGKSLAECHSACLQYADVVLSRTRSHCRSLSLCERVRTVDRSLFLSFSLSQKCSRAADLCRLHNLH